MPTKPADMGEDYVATVMLISLLQKEIGDPEIVRAMISNKVQIFRIGWIKLEDEHGNPLMRKVLLLNRDDLHKFLAMLEELIGPEGDVPEILKVWKVSIQRTVGESEEATMNDCIKKRLGIVFPDRQEILSKPLSKITRADYEAVLKMKSECNKLRDKLLTIRDSVDEYWFSTFGVEFTWLSHEDLP